MLASNAFIPRLKVVGFLLPSFVMNCARSLCQKIKHIRFSFSHR